MHSKSNLNRLASLLLLLAAASCFAGCQGKPPPKSKPPVSRYVASFWAADWMYHLRPLSPGTANDVDKAKEIWRDLFAGMAKDEKTQELLKQLHGGLSVEFIVLEAKQVNDKVILATPPPNGTAVVMRVVDLKLGDEESKTGPVPVRVIAYGRAISLKDQAAANSMNQLADDWKKEPAPGDPLVLAMQDYVLRHAPGWIVRSGPVQASDDAKLPANADDQRRELDERVKKYSDHAKAYYGALGNAK